MNHFRLVQTFLSCCYKFDHNFVLANIPRCCKWYCPLRFSNQQFVQQSHLSHSYCLSHPVHNLPESPLISSLLGQNVLFRALFCCAPHLYYHLSHSYCLSHPVHNLPESPLISSLLGQNVLFRALFCCAPHLYYLHDCDGANFTPL